MGDNTTNSINSDQTIRDLQKAKELFDATNTDHTVAFFPLGQPTVKPPLPDPTDESTQAAHYPYTSDDMKKLGQTTEALLEGHSHSDRAKRFHFLLPQFEPREVPTNTHFAHTYLLPKSGLAVPLPGYKWKPPIFTNNPTSEPAPPPAAPHIENGKDVKEHDGPPATPAAPKTHIKGTRFLS